MHRRALLGAVVALVLAGGLAACSEGGSEVVMRPAKDEPTEEVTILERASSSDSEEDIAALRAEVDELRSAIEALGLAMDDEPDGAGQFDHRLTTVERQVGVNSVNRSGVSDLWSELAKLKRSVEGYFGSGGIEQRLDDLEQCVSRMRREWGSEYAPYC